jgi:hypothetical protein
LELWSWRSDIRLLESVTAVRLADHALVQEIAALSRQAAMRHPRLELLKLSFQLLIYQEKRPQCSPNVAVAPGNDLVDGRFVQTGSHRKPSNVGGVIMLL